jgi:hypothetical protein
MSRRYDAVLSYGGRKPAYPPDVRARVGCRATAETSGGDRSERDAKRTVPRLSLCAPNFDFYCSFFTSGHFDSDSGWNATSAGIVATSL